MCSKGITSKEGDGNNVEQFTLANSVRRTRFSLKQNDFGRFPNRIIGLSQKVHEIFLE